MFTCNLSPDEASIIIDILEQVLDDLRGEQRRTEHFEYKQKLEQREAAIRKVLSELKSRQEINPSP